MRALRFRGAGEVQAVMAYFSAGGARRSTSFTHVFQLYGGFLLRALALPIVLGSRRAARRAVLPSVFIDGSTTWGLNVGIRGC